jgi:hypothetical protein
MQHATSADGNQIEFDDGGQVAVVAVQADEDDGVEDAEVVEGTVDGGITDDQRLAILALQQQAGQSDADLAAWMQEKYGVGALDDLDEDQAGQLITQLQKAAP